METSEEFAIRMEREFYDNISTKQSEVTVENKTIIITDPCYISDGECEDWKDDYEPYIVKETIYGDWSCTVYKGGKKDIVNAINEWNDFYTKWWSAYNFEGKTEEEKASLREALDQKEKEFKEKYGVYGSFCADAGMVAVYDAAKIPQEKLDWCKTHDWCACIIENYTGPIKYEVEEHVDEDGVKYRSAHIVGDGFYSSQSGF